MNIIEAAEILNIRHDADYLIVKAAYHALAKRHHPDMGGDTATMQRINQAHEYMSTRSQQARATEWERLQPAHASSTSRSSSTSSNYTTTRPWTPQPKAAQTQSRLQRFHAWRKSRYTPWYLRFPTNLGVFLLILAGRLAVVAGMFYGYAESVRWAVKALAHGWYVLLIIFPGIMIVLAGLIVTFRLAMLFLIDGWCGWLDVLDDTRLNNPNIKRWHDI